MFSAKNAVKIALIVPNVPKDYSDNQRKTCANAQKDIMILMEKLKIAKNVHLDAFHGKK